MHCSTLVRFHHNSLTETLCPVALTTELHAYNVTASVIYDLLCVKSHQAEHSNLGAADIDLIIESLCVS